jgi:hypothetical protein
MVDPSEEQLSDPFDRPNEERYGSIEFDGQSDERTREDALRAKRGQIWLAILLFVIAALLAAAVVCVGIDEKSGNVEFAYRGGVYRVPFGAVILLGGAWLSKRIATDSVTVRGKRT